MSLNIKNVANKQRNTNFPWIQSNHLWFSEETPLWWEVIQFRAAVATATWGGGLYVCVGGLSGYRSYLFVLGDIAGLAITLSSPWKQHVIYCVDYRREGLFITCCDDLMKEVMRGVESYGGGTEETLTSSENRLSNYLTVLPVSWLMK